MIVGQAKSGRVVLGYAVGGVLLLQPTCQDLERYPAVRGGRRGCYEVVRLARLGATRGGSPGCFG